MNSSEFRKELTKHLPGFRWTVHTTHAVPHHRYLVATGIVSSGFNRVATLSIERRLVERAKSAGAADVEYQVRIAGYGKNAPWITDAHGGTLARAVRSLQQICEYEAGKFGSAASFLKAGRTP